MQKILCSSILSLIAGFYSKIRILPMVYDQQLNSQVIYSQGCQYRFCFFNLFYEEIGKCFSARDSKTDKCIVVSYEQFRLKYLLF